MNQNITPKFDKLGGLIPAIVQDAATGAVLMLAFMNEEAWKMTLTTLEAHYFSRSRQTLWHKGGTSGHIQRVKIGRPSKQRIIPQRILERYALALRHQSHNLSNLPAGKITQWEAVQDYLTRARFQTAKSSVQQRGFSCAVRAEDSHNAACGRFQG